MLSIRLAARRILSPAMLKHPAMTRVRVTALCVLFPIPQLHVAAMRTRLGGALGDVAMLRLVIQLTEAKKATV